ncbi:MAG: hypothetical protein ACKV2U_22405 [Bryobacteraceae bacterium]
MAQVPGATAARASMTQTVLRYLDGLPRDPGKDPAFELEIADAYREVALIEGHPLRPNLGRIPAALDHFQRAIAIYSRLAGNETAKAHALSGLIGANIEAGDIESRAGKGAAALARLEEVAQIASDASTKDSAAIRPGTRVYLYFRLGDAELRAGSVQAALSHFERALETSQEWVAAENNANASGTLRGAHGRVGEAQKEAGDLLGARANYAMCLKLAQEALGQSGATVYDRSMYGYSHQELANLLGNPNGLNLVDPGAARNSIRLALDTFEAIAGADTRDVRARDDLAGAYRSAGAILLQDRPDESMGAYRQALAISEGLSVAEPGHYKYRRDFALSHLGIAEAIHKLGRNRMDALSHLRVAVDVLLEAVESRPDGLWLETELTRAHRVWGDVLLAIGETANAEIMYRKSLERMESLNRRAPLRLLVQSAPAQAMESLGHFYAALSRSRPALKSDAEAWLRKSLAIWRDWSRRKIAVPYAAAHERAVSGSIERLR